MQVTSEMVPDILEKIAEGVHSPDSTAQGAAYQLERIANALERIADALEPQSWAADSRKPRNVHGLLALIATHRP